MTREPEAVGGSVLLGTYTLPEGDAKAYLDGPVREDVQAGRLDGQLLDEALEHLEDCFELPQAVFHMTLRQWEANPEEVAARTLAEVAWNLALEPERQQIIDPDNMPPDTTQLLSRLYELTGASVVRDDLKEGENTDDDTGVIIRRGQYKGSEIYFRETYDDMPENSVYHVPDLDEQRSLGIEVMGKSRGEMAVLELTDSQRIDLTGLVGLSKTLKFSRPGSDAGELQVPLVNRDNFDGIMTLLEAAGQLAVKRAIGDMRDQSLALRLLIKDPFENHTDH